MNDLLSFQFQVKSRIRFGSGEAGALPELPEVCGRRCMLLSYPGFDRPALVESVRATAASLAVPNAFEENPSYDLARRLGQQVKEESIETIIAIGGGSSIDTAKAAGYFAVNPDGDAPGVAPRPAEAAVVAVPTTAGTGSEVTQYAILTDTATGNKKILKHPTLVPQVAVCDPQLTTTMPAHVTAHTGIDALSHAMEAYFSKSCQGLLADLAVKSCRRVARSLPAALAEPGNLNARQEVMLAALGGGIVLAHCGTVIVHALGYGLTREFGYAHGLANALLLAGFAEHLAARGNDRAKEILGFFSGDLRGFIAQCGVPDLLAGESIPAELREQWLDAAFNSYGRSNSVLPLERVHVGDILDRAINPNAGEPRYQ